MARRRRTRPYPPDGGLPPAGMPPDGAPPMPPALDGVYGNVVSEMKLLSEVLMTETR
jgi:hypothetical protein